MSANASLFQPDGAGTGGFGKALYAATEAAGKQVVERVVEVAANRGAPHAQVALAQRLSKPYVMAPIDAPPTPDGIVNRRTCRIPCWASRDFSA